MSFSREQKAVLMDGMEPLPFQSTASSPDHCYTKIKTLVKFTVLLSRVHVLMKRLVVEFLIGSYGTPLAQRTSYLALHSSLFGPVAQLIMIILSLTALTLN